MLFSNLTQITILPHWSGCQSQPEYLIKIQFFPVKPYVYITFLLNMIFQYLSTLNYNSILGKISHLYHSNSLGQRSTHGR